MADFRQSDTVNTSGTPLWNEGVACELRATDYPDPEEVARKLASASMSVYASRAERAALRCALGDAAGLCDAVARMLAENNRGRLGKGAVTVRGRQFEHIAKMCGDTIWAMRDRIKVTEDPQP